MISFLVQKLVWTRRLAKEKLILFFIITAVHYLEEKLSGENFASVNETL